MIVKLLTERHLEFLSLKGGSKGSSESAHVKMTHFFKSHAMAILLIKGGGGNYTDIGQDRQNLSKKFE